MLIVQKIHLTEKQQRRLLSFFFFFIFFYVCVCLGGDGGVGGVFSIKFFKIARQIKQVCRGFHSPKAFCTSIGESASTSYDPRISIYASNISVFLNTTIETIAIVKTLLPILLLLPLYYHNSTIAKVTFVMH